MNSERTEDTQGIEVPLVPARNSLLLLPPMANSYAVGLASAELFDPQLLPEVGIAVSDTADGDPAPSEVIDATASLMAQMLGTTNSQYFRFELAAVHEAGEPKVRRMGPGLHALVEEALTDIASTRKLTLLVPVEVPGQLSAQIGIAALGKDRDLEAGTAYVTPSYLVPVVNINESDGSYGHEVEAESNSSEVILLVAHALGPAFR